MQWRNQNNYNENLQAVYDATPIRDIKILTGDLNAKIGSDNTGKDTIMGVHGLGQSKWSPGFGELFTSVPKTT